MRVLIPAFESKHLVPLSRRPSLATPFPLNPDHHVLSASPSGQGCSDDLPTRLEVGRHLCGSARSQNSKLERCGGWGVTATRFFSNQNGRCCYWPIQLQFRNWQRLRKGVVLKGCACSAWASCTASSGNLSLPCPLGPPSSCACIEWDDARMHLSASSTCRSADSWPSP